MRRAEREANAKAAALEAERKAAEAERKAVRRAVEARKRAIRKAPMALFSGSVEANGRLSAVLDALDFLACESSDGWIRIAAWEGRRRSMGYTGKEGSVERQWSRRLRRMRLHGIDYVSFASEEAGGIGATGRGNPNEPTMQPWERTAFRLTPEGLDRLRALVAALDDWLCSRKDGDV